MKNISEQYLEKMQDGLRTFVPRMSIDGVELDGDIQSRLAINTGSCGAEDFSIGTAFIPYITASIAECSTTLQDKEILLEMGLILADSTIEYVKMGYFTVEKPVTDKYQTSFTAYGRLMSKAGDIFQNTLTYPTTIQSVLDEVSRQTGLTIKLNGLTAEGQIDTPIIGELNREVLMRIAGLLGGFVTEDGDGNVVISKYALNRSVTVDTDFCYTYPETNDTEYTVTGIEVLIREDGTDEEGNTIAGEKYTSDSVVNVAVQNPYMTESLFETCESNIVGFSYMPAKVEFLGDISLEPWDSIVLTDEDPDAGIDIPCMSIVHTWDGGLVTTVTAPGSTSTEDLSSFGGPLSTIIERTYQKLLVAEQIIATKVTAEYVEANYATIKALNATNANIETLTAKAITTDNLTAKVAELGYLKAAEAEIKYATITNLNALSASVTDLSAKAITTDNLTAKVAELGYLKATEAELKYATIETLEVQRAEIDQIFADYVKTEVLESEYIKASEIDAKYATITSLGAVSADITNLTSIAITTTNLSAKVAELGYAKVTELEAVEGKIDNLTSIAITTENLSAKVGEFGYITVKEVAANYATVIQLYATNANVSELQSDVATIEKAYISTAAVNTLLADYVKTETLTADYITAAKISSTYATISNLNSATARIGNLESTTVKASELEAKVGTFGYLKSSSLSTEVAKLGYATADSLEAVDAKFDTLSSTYATIDLANVKDGSITTAMIGAGVVGTAQIADGSITDAKIVGLTANKITAGRLDAAQIEVVNLNAANITVGTINGQQIAAGAIDINKLSSGLSQTITDAGSNAQSALTVAENNKKESIYSVDVLYALGASETTAPTSGWNATAPAWESGKYMWQKTVTTFGDGTKAESEPTCITGAKGQTGAIGPTAPSIYAQHGNCRNHAAFHYLKDN